MSSRAATCWTCTPEHPLYVQGQGWVEAGSLGIGTSIVSRAEPALEVTSLTWQKNKAQELAAGIGSSFGGYTVYNLTVADDHTFFVGTTGGGTWVHNMVCETLYRGVSRDHPGYGNALNGEAASRGGPSNALQHQAGLTDSPFTSWSSDPSVAGRFAGNDGIIMQKEFDASADYFWRMPNSGYGEEEVLIEGSVTGAGIYHP